MRIATPFTRRMRGTPCRVSAQKGNPIQTAACSREQPGCFFVPSFRVDILGVPPGNYRVCTVGPNDATRCPVSPATLNIFDPCGDGVCAATEDKATCLDKRTGDEKFRKRLPGGTTCVGSPLVVGDRIYVINEKGTTLVLKAGPAFEILGESTLGRGDEVFWATPAVAGDALLIRSSDALYCVRE